MALTAATVFRKFETDGVPSSGLHKVKKEDAVSWGTWLESFVTAIGANSGSIFANKAALDADLAHAANSMAWVVGDATTANNGIYRKNGASGSGSWTRLADLPYSFISATSVGGTPNALDVVTGVPVSDQILVTFLLVATNTASPTTVSFNGDPPLTIKTNTGFDPDVGALRAGMTLSGFKVGDEFLLLTDNMASALLTAIEAIRDDAEDAADTATTKATAAQASATEAAMYAEMVGAAAFDFNVDSDPSTPGYDWND